MLMEMDWLARLYPNSLLSNPIKLNGSYEILNIFCDLFCSMKIVKMKPKAYSVKKELISKFGELVYHSEGVESVFIKINFADGSSIGFRRSEGDDAVESIFGDDEDE